ncbi:MAG: hypothetical protein IJR34_05355 [Bacteroidales bacterium]|nr:hypothetical protein [Bacteroidales bacterium]
MKKFLPFLLLILLGACEKSDPSWDELLPPGTFNLSTVITDSNGNSLDIAGDWAIFQDPGETKFTKFIHFDQISDTIYSVEGNKVFMLEYDAGRETLPVYDNGTANKRRTLFIKEGTTKLIYKDGRIHLDFRSDYGPRKIAYSSPTLYVVLDENTLGDEDYPNYRLRRIKSFSD